jgi:4-hydroxy-3-methylbut-2-en-1-yl diphosphate synthase IspG/GcpE
MRIGVNHGSLSERIKVMYGDSPVGMVESALEYIRICEAHGFKEIVVSLKASRVPVMLSANRLMVERMQQLGMDYPLHLGVTEAGDGIYARIKSAIGIGTLLAEGIGDTIRVSLAEDPVNEIEVCYDILQALGLRKTKVEYIACPSCGRTKFDLPTVLNQVREATKHLVGLDIAVMGCLPPEQPVMTARGLKPIASVQVGEWVLTDQGKLEPVSAVERHTFEGELIEIVPRGALPLRLTPNHPLLALTRTSTYKAGRIRYQNVADLADSWREARWYAAENLTRAHVLLYPIIQCEQVIERIANTPELSVDAAFLKFAACYLAEGSIGGANGRPRQVFITLGMGEAQLAATLRSALCQLGIPFAERTRTDRNTYEIVIHSTELAEQIVALFGRRAENKHLPPEWLNLPRETQADFLRTLWQCDGYCGVVNGYPRANYVTVSSALAFAVHQMLLRLGITASFATKRPHNRKQIYVISVTSGEALRRFADWLDFKLEVPETRQRTGRIGIDSRYLYLPIVAIRRVPYRGVVYNLEIARAHTYVASLCAVHNCIVNGPGEMADADYGYVGRGSGKIALYRKGQLVKNDIPAERGVEELIELLKADGVWRDPTETTP